MVTLIVIKNPFDIHDRDIKQLDYSAVKTLAGYVADTGIIDEVKVAVNGGLIEPELWATTTAADGTNIIICPVIGKGGGKNILGLVASIALSVVAMGVGNFISAGNWAGLGLKAGMASWTFAGYCAAASIMYIGGTLMNNATALDAVIDSDYTKSATYSWTTAKTQATQGSPIPMTFGSLKIKNNNVLSAHVTTDGDQQYLNLLVCGGEGPIDAIEDIRIDGNPIANYDGVTVETRIGLNDQKAISIPSFADNYSDQSLSYELTTDGWKTQLVDGNAVQGLEILIEFPNGLYFVNDQGGVSTTGVRLEAQYRFVGSDTWIDYFEPVINTTTTVITYNIYTQQKEIAANGGKTTKTVVTTTTTYGTSISAASSSALRRSYRLDKLAAGSYEVRCRLISKDGSTSRYSNRCYWTQVSGIIPDDFAYPGLVLVAIKALATSQLSGSSPAITWLQRRNKVLVFNPATNAYEEKPATNPAWACYDILHLCKKIYDERKKDWVYDVQGCPASLIMYNDFARWAAACDARGVVCNYYLDSVGDLDAAWKPFEAAGRGKVVRRGTKYGCIYDHVAEPVQMFSVGNIKMSTFALEYLPVEDRANAVEITFNNERKDYERDTMIVYGDGYDEAEADTSSPTQITLDAITNPDTVYREGKYYLRKNKYLIRTITFEADVDAVGCQVGDVVLVQHDVPQWGFGGRLESAAPDLKTLVLDREVEMDEGKTYEITVRLQDDTIVKRAVNTVVGSTNVVTVTTDMPALPAQYDVYSFGETMISTKPVTVAAITRSSDTVVKLETIEYNEAVYSEAKDVPVINYSKLDILVDIETISLGQETYCQKDGAIISNIYVSWTISRGKVAKSYDVYLSVDGISWSRYVSTSEQKIVISGVKSSLIYYVKVRAVNEAGTSGITKTGSIMITGKDKPPPNVTGLLAVVNSADRTQAVLSWDPVIAVDLNHYRVKVNETEYNTTATTTTIIANVNNQTVSVVAVDNSGNISSNPAIITTATVINPADVVGFIVNQRATDRSIIDMRWAALSDTDLSHYEIRMGDTWETGKIIDKVKSLNTSYQLTGSGYYRFWTAAVNAAGHYSVHKTMADIQAHCEPDQPTNLAYVQDVRNAKRVMLNWTAAAGQDIAGYEISRNGIVVGFAADTAYTDTVSVSGTYTYNIRTKTVGAFYSGYAHLTAAVMLEPLDVTGFKAVQQMTDKSVVRLTWDANRAGDLSHYEIREGAVWDTGKVVVAHAIGTYADINISEEKNYTWQIKAISSNGYSSLYPAIVAGIFSLNPTPVKEIQVKQSADDKAVLNIQWAGVDDKDLAGYQVKIGDAWDSAEALPLTKELYTIYTLAVSNGYRIMIKTLNNSGFYSDEISIDYRAIIEPSDVLGLVAFQNGDSIELYWDKSADADVIGYEIREGYSFDQSSLISTGVTNTSITIDVDTMRLYKYHVKAINRSGHYSRMTASVSINVTSIAPRNIIDTYDEIALASGTHNNTEFGQSSLNFQTLGGRFSDYPTTKFSEVGGSSVLKLVKQTDGTYYRAGIYTTETIDIGSVITCNVTALFTSSTMLQGGAVTLQVRSSQDGSTWLEWAAFKPVQRTFRYIQFRVFLETNDAKKTPEVNQFMISIDVPDTDIALSATIAAGGTIVNYGHTYYTIPYVTPCAIGENLHAELISKDKASCVIKIKDKNNNDVGGTADVRIKGY